MNKSIYLFILLGIITSCSIKKRVSNNLPLDLKTPKDFIEKINSKRDYPDWLSLKGKISFSENEKKLQFNTSIHHKKDSIIWISVTAALGIEIIRAQLTPDSIYLINRTNKTYLSQSISQIKKHITSDFNFYDIQDIITYNLKVQDDKYKIKIDDIYFSLENNNYSYLISNQFLIKQAKIIDGNNTIEFVFEKFKTEDNFPRYIALKIKSKKKFDLSIDYSKVIFNKPKKIKFQIPENYESIR